MFWKKKNKVAINAPIYYTRPMQKEIRLMHDILDDIQKYHDRNFKEVRDILLTALSEQVDSFKKTNANEPNRSI